MLFGGGEGEEEEKGLAFTKGLKGNYNPSPFPIIRGGVGVKERRLKGWK